MVSQLIEPKIFLVAVRIFSRTQNDPIDGLRNK